MSFSIRLHTRQLEQLVSQFRLLQRLCPLPRIDLAIHLGLSLRVDIDMRPVCRRLPLLKDPLLLLEVFLGRHSRRCVARIDDCADVVGLGVHGVVHLSRVPQDEITRLGAHLDHLAALVLVPLYVRVLEGIEVVVKSGEGALGSVWWVLLEELVEEFGAALHYDEAAVFGSCLGD
jgi:hypothetical protein